MTFSWTRISSLRLWLQRSLLLAVLAGYGMLLIYNRVMADVQRRANHQQQINLIQADLSQRSATLAGLDDLTSFIPSSGWRLSPAVIDFPSKSQPALRHRDGQVWLATGLTLRLKDGNAVPVWLEQNVTASVEREHQSFLLLIAMAGWSALLTSALVRLLLRRGLVKPLHDFASELSAMEGTPSASARVDVASQPEELQPIAMAFNGLQLRLQSSWERQRSFVDGVAHELRTPITLISGHAQRLLRQHLDDASDRPLRLISEEATRMTSLVSDLLDIARRDSGRLSLRCQPLIADDVLLELFERMEPKAAGRLQLQLSDEASPLPLGWADPHRLQQCLTTLVDNALQYSPPPSTIILFSGVHDSGEVVLHVRDHGPGVAPDERQSIFERFMRGSASIGNPNRGSGIGLAVVQLLMEAMGGRAQVTEAEGGGADFQLLLQAVSPSADPP